MKHENLYQIITDNQFSILEINEVNNWIKKFEGIIPKTAFELLKEKSTTRKDELFSEILNANNIEFDVFSTANKLSLIKVLQKLCFKTIDNSIPIEEFSNQLSFYLANTDDLLAELDPNFVRNIWKLNEFGGLKTDQVRIYENDFLRDIKECIENCKNLLINYEKSKPTDNT